MQTPTAAADAQTRNKGRLGLEMAAENADKLGDDVNSSEGDLARPDQTGNPADAGALQQLDKLEPETLALLDGASDAIGAEQEMLKSLPSRPTGDAEKQAYDAYRKAVRAAQGQNTGLKREVEAAQKMRLSDPVGAVTQFTGLRDRAQKLRDDAEVLASQRPAAPLPRPLTAAVGERLLVRSGRQREC